MSGAGCSPWLWRIMLLTLLVLDVMQIYGICSAGPLRRQDFFGLWSFARFVQSHPAAEIYDQVRLNLFQHRLDPGFTLFYPFAYPPDFLLLIWPLGHLPYWTARLLWTGISAALFCRVLWRTLPGWRGTGVALALMAPACIDNLLTGETGFFIAAALLGAVLAPAPWVAGLCVGLLTLKPQLGILLPFALAGRGEWRTMLIAALVTLALIGLSCLAFSPGPWGAWWQALKEYHALEGENAAHLAPLMTSLTATATSLGLPGWSRTAVAIAGIALGGGICAWIFARGERRLAAAALFTGTFAVTPHALFYDAPVLVFSVLMLWRQTEWARADLLLGLAALLLPLLAGGPLTHVTPAGPLYLLLFLRLAWLAVRGRPLVSS